MQIELHLLNPKSLGIFCTESLLSDEGIIKYQTSKHNEICSQPVLFAL